MKKYFTTPIYYVNDVPHIGHTYSTLATDTLARYWREKLGAENVFFTTGTDENSQKTIQAAQKSEKTIPQYLEDMAHIWKTTWEKCGITFDDFIRTTEKRHLQTVHHVLETIYQKGDIYKGTYKGHYCEGCESFLKESDLDENGHCPDHKKPPQVIEEENYFFRLSAYQEQLLEMYENHPDLLLPEKRKNEVLHFIRSGLEDISISREGKKWGIPLPWDKNHVVYVWFDALINYYTSLTSQKGDSSWEETEIFHILGKDITKFHCIIWPAMLMSAMIKTPEKMFAHGFFTVNGTKMSKSLGNVISPLDLSEKYGNDALRVGILGSFEFGNDGDFSLKNFEEMYAKKLAGGVGNLFNRVIVLIHKFLDGEKPKSSEKIDLVPFEKALENGKLKQAIDFFFATVDHTNERLNETQVWTLAKTDLEGSKKIFAELLASLEALTEMSKILLPYTYPQMKKMMGDAQKVGEKQILFPPRN